MTLEKEMFYMYETRRGNVFYIQFDTKRKFFLLRKVFLLEEELVQVKTGATMRKSRKIS